MIYFITLGYRLGFPSFLWNGAILKVVKKVIREKG